MKTDRWFYSAAVATFIVMMLVGFRWFITSATGDGGRVIDPVVFRLDLVHGLAIAAWYVLFFTKSLLIGVRDRRLHFKLGWSAIAVALAIAATGPLVAIRSVQISPPEFHFFGMQYSRFLLVMLTEIALYTAFVTIAILTRKKPRIHRSAMVLASLCLLEGAQANSASGLRRHRLAGAVRTSLLPRRPAPAHSLHRYPQLRSLVSLGICVLGRHLHRV